MIIYKPKRKGQVTKRKAMVKTGKRPAKKKAARRKRLPLLDSLQTRQNMQRLSVIIPVRDEERTIGKVLKQVVRLRPKEIIVIANGSRDRTIQIATTYNVTCLSYPFPLGHDVGRAIGAKEASGDVLLFLDGDIVIPAERLQRFVKACYLGADISLNNVNRFFNNTARIDAVSMAKSYLNRLLLRPDLGFSSMTAVPHAMKRSVAAWLGYDSLMVPPLAQAKAILQGMRVVQSASVDVLRTNRKRIINQKTNNLVKDLILGDHMEALSFLQSMKSERVFFFDQLRRRHIFGHIGRTAKLASNHFVLPNDV
ncbi:MULTISPECIES: glycosyltransferase family 2 protein [Brevibacillus]|uniref:4,4'-diaponeurosporenoate glycosyltransferase n=2 Tax=Brevibacillus borstelensis TaxID=45462 RepID=M8E5Z2_9BACL|nr:glycosyltransferase [Brevibacillus borstelensis]EMT50885.1 family 2 glycosyl transferase [Brevibacillus borstelensis AK1]MBE5396438.1 glycosyltransferase family 2 protein [Brevibacillus borstelensis]MED1745994.1 glycosyltransferase [Brevibacillus borstelensis]MED1884815.1 glycosyltransferase [Brevibacillus borstelensis]RNB57483.1 glycosyltransferase [Brevibacillus borstelensis]